jgi:hypothetical protein
MRRIQGEDVSILSMPVSLTKTGLPQALPNLLTIACPVCDQTYELGYSDDEWNRVKDWINVARRCLREDHKRKHELPSHTLAWKPVRGR